MKEVEKYSTEVHNQIIGWTENCDTKASIILAFVGVLVSVTFTSEYLLSGIEMEIKNIISYWNDNVGSFSFISALMFIALIGFVILMAQCCYFALLSLKANVDCSDNSIIFFDKIVESSKENYIENVNEITDDEYKRDKLSQIYNCAKICSTKFCNYNKSVRLLSFGMSCFVCFILFVIILKALCI